MFVKAFATLWKRSSPLVWEMLILSEHLKVKSQLVSSINQNTVGKPRCFNSQEAEWPGPKMWGKEPSWCVAKGSEHAMHQLQKAAAPVKSLTNARMLMGAVWAFFPRLLLASSWEGRQARSWLVEGMKILQERLGCQRRAHWLKRVSDLRDKNRVRDEWHFRLSFSTPLSAFLPIGVAHSAGCCCCCSKLLSSSFPS